MWRRFQKRTHHILSTVSVSCYHLSSKSDMLIRSMSALDSPPLLSALTTVWKQMGLREEGKRGGTHMPSMLCLANGFGNGRRLE